MSERNEMVERVAEEIRAKLIPSVASAIPWAKMDRGQDEYRASARAAIAVMRNPTEAMKSAWTDAAPSSKVELMVRYQAMIDAALDVTKS